MSSLAPSLSPPADGGFLALMGFGQPTAPRDDRRAAMEARVARDKARAQRILDSARDLGGDAQARFATLIPEALWVGARREFLLHAIGASPYDDWNLALVTTAPEALDAGALPAWPQMEARAADIAHERLAQIEAGFRADGDAEAARKALARLAAEIRARWERHATCGE
jgi:hypothetical protein